MIYNPDKHHRRSIRLKEYDYSQAGAYFVTICTQDRDCLFGDIIEGKIQLNPAGNMIHNWWNQIAQKYLNVELDECVIMPNHIHGIIIVGADPRVCPDTENGNIVIDICEHNDPIENKSGEQKGSHTSISDEHINSHMDILCEGRMGIVYLAKDTKLERSVTIKLLL